MSCNDRITFYLGESFAKGNIDLENSDYSSDYMLNFNQLIERSKSLIYSKCSRKHYFIPLSKLLKSTNHTDKTFFFYTWGYLL